MTMTRNIIALILLSINLSPEMVAVLPEVNNAATMDICGGEMFVLDGVEVKVYSLEDYRFLRKFGKRGEGPGELVNLRGTDFSMILQGDKVILHSVIKAIIYEKSGKIIKEVKFSNSNMLLEAVQAGNNFVATKFCWVDATATAETFICNPGFKEIKKIYTTALLQSYKKQKIAMPPVSTFARCAGDRIFLFDQQKYTIKVFDLEGNPKPDIKFSYGRIKTDDSFKKRVNDALKIDPMVKNSNPGYKKMIYTPDVLPVFRNCQVIGDRFYIETYRQKGDKSEFLIIDFSGNVEKKLFLPGAASLELSYIPVSNYAFFEGKYYYLVENIDEEEWELHVQEIN